MKNSLETRLGLFFALALIATMIIFEIVGGTDFFKPSYFLYAQFDTVLELKEGDQVKMAGKQIGKVKSIEFAGDEVNKIKVVMKLEKKYKVKTDSVATIKFAGLMGQHFVSINLGSPDKPVFLQAGEIKDAMRITVVEQSDFSALMQKLDNAVGGVEKMTASFSGDSIQNVLGPIIGFVMDVRPALTNSIFNFEKVSKKIADGEGTVGKLIMDEELHNSAVATINNLNKTADEVKGTLDEAKSLIVGAKSAVSEAKSALTEARIVVADINAGKGTLGKMAKDETLYKETTTAVMNMREIMEKINRGQGSVGKLVNDESMFKNIKMTLQKVDKATEELEDSGPLSVLTSVVGKLF